MISMWTLYKLAVRQYLHGKRWMVMTLLFLLPAALALLVRHTARNVTSLELEFSFSFMLIPQAILPLAALVFASGIIQDELEEQTITYLLIRPIPRWGIYAVKLLAAITITAIMTLIFTLLTYAAIYSGHDWNDGAARAIEAAPIHALAILCYCCIFGLLGLLTKRILIAGIVYIIVVEGLLANLPFGIRLITVIYYTRLIAFHILPFTQETPNGTENLASDAWNIDAFGARALEQPGFQTCLIVLFGASVALALIGSVLCSRREFYVKTQEKN